MELVPKPPPPEHRLDTKTASGVPASRGVYAAWIVDERALAEAGIGGVPPVLLYVGKAGGAAGLRARLTRHAAHPWWELVDLLASRGTVLPGWWSYAEKNTTHRTLRIPPLAAVAEAETRAWQHENLRWGWISKPRTDVRAYEAALIAMHRPLLNRHGRGYKAEPLVQLRAVGIYEDARVWWLFHVAWLAVLTLRPQAWVRRSLNGHVIAADEHGWPVCLDEGTHHKLRIPGERAARGLLARAAPPALHDAVSGATSSAEATAWWAAYAGHAFLKQPDAPDVALRAALTRSSNALRAPQAGPSESGHARLVDLVRQLPSVAH